jgi:hypothetical protein
MGWDDRCDFSELIGKTLTEVKASDDQIDFTCSDGSEYRQFHDQDCCENVSVDDVTGDWADVIGSPIIVATEASNSDDPPKGEYAESYTWTFYKLDTAKGGVTVRWYGSSNGYYSERVSFERLRGPAQRTTC